MNSLFLYLIGLTFGYIRGMVTELNPMNASNLAENDHFGAKLDPHEKMYQIPAIG